MNKLTHILAILTLLFAYGCAPHSHDEHGGHNHGEAEHAHEEEGHNEDA